MDPKIRESLTKYSDLFSKRSFAQLATLMPDGSPQVSPVWVDFDGEYILVNTAQGRQKDRNLKHDPRVAIAIQDPNNAYRKVLVRGRVEQITTQGADEHIDKLSERYTGNKIYQNRRAGEVREILKIKPEHVTG